MGEKVIGKVSTATPKIITLDKIKDVVCDYFSITSDTFQSATRHRRIAEPRQIAMFLARQHTETALSTIGTALGTRDNATRLHACKAVNNYNATD